MISAADDRILDPAGKGHHKASKGCLSRIWRLAVWVVLMHLGLLAYDAWLHAPNYIEANLLPAGYLHLNYGRFDSAQVNTPLSRTVCAVPLFFFDVQEDWSTLINTRGFRSEYAIGEEFIENNTDSLRAMFFAARLMASLFSVIGAFAIYKLAGRFYGPQASLVAVVIWCFSPMVLGHAGTVNHDVAGAAMLALALVWFLGLCDDPCLVNAFLFAVFGGLAILTRTTCGFVIAGWIVWFIIVPQVSPHSVRRWRRAGLSAIAVCVMLFLLNLGYEFTGSMKRLGDYDFYSRALAGEHPEFEPANRFRGTVLGRLPLPFPKDFIIGLDLQQKDFETPEFQSYLREDWQAHGWWYYYIYAWLVKTPIGFQILMLLALVGTLRDLVRKQSVPFESVLLISIVIPFAIASLKHGFTIHYRYVLPAFPFLAVLAGRLWHGVRLSSARGVTLNLLLGYGVISSLLVYPHSMSYFNEWVGGPKNGGKHLLYSSCDWGQDQYFLQDWYLKHQKQDVPIFLRCHGMIPFHDVGLPPNTMPFRTRSDFKRQESEREIVPGLYAISVSHLYGPEAAFRYLELFEPVKHIGYSIKVFKLTEEDIQQHFLNKLSTADSDSSHP